MVVLDGKATSAKIRAELAEQVKELKAKGAKSHISQRYW
jgi:5,10-methylene-tetrahydrofolate dehydrogenase/methenyl tetrahydrofolate cyclohydrolase